MKVAIYLAGSIQKGHEKNGIFWTEDDRQIIQENLSPIVVTFLNPASRSDDLSDQKSVFGRDMLQVYGADIVFVDARERRGLGVGAEMMWAKFRKTPIVTLAPKNSHYHKDQTSLLGVDVTGWVHPFIESLSDVIVEDLQEGCDWISHYLFDRSIKIKGIEDIHEAMRYYSEKQLSKDTPMQALIEKSRELQERVQKINL